MKKVFMVLLVCLIAGAAFAENHIKADVGAAIELGVDHFGTYRGLDVCVTGRHDISDFMRVGIKADYIFGEEEEAVLAFGTFGYVYNVERLGVGIDLGLGFSKAVRGSYVDHAPLLAIDLAVEGSFRMSDAFSLDFGADALLAITREVWFSNYGAAFKPYIGLTVSF